MADVDPDDDVYHCDGERLQLKRETENSVV